MSIKKLSDQIYVGPQIEIDDIEDLQISGVKSVICLRPDGEGAGQPAFEALKTQTTSLGIVAHYLPIIPGQISNAQIAEFADMVTKSPSCGSIASHSTTIPFHVSVQARWHSG